MDTDMLGWNNELENVAYTIFCIAETSDRDALDVLKTFCPNVRVKIPVSKAIYKISTDSLEGFVSTRVFNCLKREGLKTIGDVVNTLAADESLTYIRNFGRKSANELKTVVFAECYGFLSPYEKLQFWRDVILLNTVPANTSMA